MLKRLFQYPFLLVFGISAISIRIFSLQETWVEAYYSGMFYPLISVAIRALLGWIPFSVGDFLYGAATLYLVFVLWRGFKKIRAYRAVPLLWGRIVRKVVTTALSIYILFNVLWGLNYNRQGISRQLALREELYTADELAALVQVLQQKLCVYGNEVSTLERSRLSNNAYLFAEGVTAYEGAVKRFPFLQYHVPSIKPSLLTPLGQYFGFTGYYNPFTGEAQLKTSIPVFLKPFVLCHEMAHQIGYAKENEANLVGFLAGRERANPEFRYSVYFEMYLYALGELSRRERNSAALFLKTAHPQVLRDRQEYLNYLTSQQNIVEPLVSRFYDRYLKLNNQPKGKGSYNAVVAWLIAYAKKYGASAI
ncbi:MAG: DUF3810 domain-containing protein [Chitinophagaceae bacterium]